MRRPNTYGCGMVGKAAWGKAEILRYLHHQTPILVPFGEHKKTLHHRQRLQVYLRLHFVSQFLLSLSGRPRPMSFRFWRFNDDAPFDLSKRNECERRRARKELASIQCEMNMTSWQRLTTEMMTPDLSQRNWSELNYRTVCIVMMEGGRRFTCMCGRAWRQ